MGLHGLSQGQLYIFLRNRISVDWFHLAEVRAQWRTLVKTVMNLRVP
jgi:hypothetical protein